MTDVCCGSSISHTFWGWNPVHRPCAVLVCEHVCACMRACKGAEVHLWRSEDDLPRSFLSCRHMSLGGQTQAVKLDSRCLCLLSHLTGIRLSLSERGGGQPRPAYCFFSLHARSGQEQNRAPLTPSHKPGSPPARLWLAFIYLHAR